MSGGFFSILPLTVSMLLSWGFESPYEYFEPEAAFSSSVAGCNSTSEMGSCESGWKGADEFGPNESLRQEKNRAGGGMAGRGAGGHGERMWVRGAACTSTLSTCPAASAACACRRVFARRRFSRR